MTAEKVHNKDKNQGFGNYSLGAHDHFSNVGTLPQNVKESRGVQAKGGTCA